MVESMEVSKAPEKGNLLAVSKVGQMVILKGMRKVLCVVVKMDETRVEPMAESMACAME